MQWYLAKIIFRIIPPKERASTQFEEQLRLVCAENTQDALQKACAWAEKEEAEFFNKNGEKIGWEFIAVPELRGLPDYISFRDDHTDLSGTTDGLELNSHMEEVQNAAGYIALQRDKHARLFLQINNSPSGREALYSLNMQADI